MTVLQTVGFPRGPCYNPSMSQRIELARAEIERILQLVDCPILSEDTDLIEPLLIREDSRIDAGGNLPSVDGAMFGGGLDAPAISSLVAAALTVAASVMQFRSHQSDLEKTRILERLAHSNYVDYLRAQLTQAGVSIEVAEKVATEVKRPLNPI